MACAFRAPVSVVFDAGPAGSLSRGGLPPIIPTILRSGGKRWDVGLAPHEIALARASCHELGPAFLATKLWLLRSWWVQLSMPTGFGLPSLPRCPGQHPFTASPSPAGSSQPGPSTLTRLLKFHATASTRLSAGRAQLRWRHVSVQLWTDGSVFLLQMHTDSRSPIDACMGHHWQGRFSRGRPRRSTWQCRRAFTTGPLCDSTGQRSRGGRAVQPLLSRGQNTVMRVPAKKRGGFSYESTRGLLDCYWVWILRLYLFWKSKGSHRVLEFSASGLQGASPGEAEGRCGLGAVQGLAEGPCLIVLFVCFVCLFVCLFVLFCFVCFVCWLVGWLVGWSVR